jgi:nickel/cobalt exporter
MTAGFVSWNDMRALRPLTALLFSGMAFAHPMGNLSVNHYARLEPGAKGVDVTYVLDLAEIPTFELTQTWNVAHDAARQVLDAKAAAQAREWMANLSFHEGGKALQPKIRSTQLAIVDGAGNLPVYRITTRMEVAATGGRLEYEDRNYPTRAGWREIVIRPGAGANVTKASESDSDVSQALTSYPQDPTKAPPQDSHAWFEWSRAGSPATQTRKPVIQAEPAPAASLTVAPPPEIVRDVRPPEAQSMGTVKRNDAISNILRTKHISWPLMATLIGLAFWFGALHALEPGHGKTMVAAYLVGSRGTPKHAMMLGGMVTFTHTISVFVLGIATMFLSRYIMPDKISKVLGVLSGLSIIWIGGMLLWRRARSLKGAVRHEHHHHEHDHDHAHSHDHDHAHSHDHDHAHSHDHDHAHSHDHDHGGLTHTHDGHTHSHVPEGEISVGSLLALGASGGLVPCPSALILLLSAISIGRVGLGMVLLLAFSVGLAIVLMATGMAVLYAKRFLPERTRGDNAFFRYMPVFSAAAILVIGVVMTSVSLGWIAPSRFFG